MRAHLIGWLTLASVFVLSAPVWAVAEDPAASAPPAESIPYKEQPAVGVGAVQRVALVLVLAIAVCFAAAFWLRREFAKRGLLSVTASDRIAVVASRRVAPRLTVFLVSVDDQAYVMVQSGNEVQLVPHGFAAASND